MVVIVCIYITFALWYCWYTFHFSLSSTFTVTLTVPFLR